ncbi:guanylate cyclase [Plakobranchus ocellatus]|uniref:Guanylate cyclase n=1 Tax=Plakobranchus ocellatus TaxID=259542 RepID=A0AAV3Y0P2_9GAST|nr:guanylate cyclase [Plakobranchus ocellatus]
MSTPKQSGLRRVFVKPAEPMTIRPCEEKTTRADGRFDSDSSIFISTSSCSGLNERPLWDNEGSRESHSAKNLPSQDVSIASRQDSCSTQYPGSPYSNSTTNLPPGHAPTSFNSGPDLQSHSASPTYLSLSPQRLSPFLNYLSPSCQSCHLSPSPQHRSPAFLSPSPQRRRPRSGYCNRSHTVANPFTFSLSPSGQTQEVCLELNKYLTEDSEMTPTARISITKSSYFPTQSCSPRAQSSLTSSLNVSLGNIDSHAQASNYSSADAFSETERPLSQHPLTSALNYYKPYTDLPASPPEKRDTPSQRPGLSSSSSSNNITSPNRPPKEETSASVQQTSSSLHDTSAPTEENDCSEENLRAPAQPPLKVSSHHQHSVLFLRQISILSITVPEMQAVFDLASQAEYFSIFSQLTDMMMDRIQQYHVFIVEQTKFTLVIGAGTQGADATRCAQEVSSLALDLMSSFGDLEIDYSCDRKIRPKIGIHTGPCIAFVPSAGRIRLRVVGNVAQHALQHMDQAFPNSILVSSRTCDLLMSAKSPFELVKRDYQPQEPRFLQRSRFLSGHLNSSAVWGEARPTVYQLVTRPKYSFDSDDLYTLTQHKELRLKDGS